MPNDVVVLLHAFPLDHTMWESQVQALTGRYRVIAPDVRGFGSAQPPAPWSMEDAVADIERQLTGLNVDDFSLVGLSMGGYIALPFYARFSERIRKLVLANTRARADNETERSARTDMIAAVESVGTSVLPDKMLPRLLKPNPAADVVKKVRAMIERADPQAVINALMAIRDRHDHSTLLHHIACPTLVIAGEQDAITRLEECREMAAALPNGTFAPIGNAGHLTNMENAAEFNRVLEKFLASESKA